MPGETTAFADAKPTVLSKNKSKRREKKDGSAHFLTVAMNALQGIRDLKGLNPPTEGFLGPNVNMHAEVYQPLVTTCEAVVDDWRNARRFKPLKVQVPKNVAWGVFGEPINVPVVARADDLQLVVTASDRYVKYFSRQPNATFYRVTKDWVEKCTWREGKLDVELIEKVLAEEPDVRDASAK